MPMIHIEYDNEKVSNDEIIALSNAIQKIVSEETEIDDVFVYANSSEVKVKIAPLEIFVRMSDNKIDDENELMERLKKRLSDWKSEESYIHPINLTLIPMHWKIEVGI